MENLSTDSEKEKGVCMREIWLRIVIAALISASGIFATHVWSHSQRVVLSPSGPEPVARISTSVNDVQRRPAQRLIWQSILRNQELYPGEAVRTASNAEARIEFIGQGTVIQLDPDTVIEIEKNSSGINLDFLKGNIFIRSSGKDDKITLQSGEQKIEVANSDVVLSKSDAKSRMEVEVVRGDVKILDRNNNARPVMESPKLKILHPSPGEAYYVAPGTSERVLVEWAPVDSSYLVGFEIGESRDQLVPVVLEAPVSGSQGRALIPMDIGKRYLKLVAKSPRSELPTLASSLVRADVRAKLPPQLLEPTPNSSFLPTSEKKDVLFSWTNPGRLNDIYLEVARSPDLRVGIYSKKMNEDLTHSLIVQGEPGLVYWRVSGRLPGTTQMVSSPIQHFHYGKKAPDPLLAPVLRWPENQKVVGLLESREEGIRLKWEPVLGAKAYDLTLIEEGSDGRTFRREIPGNETVVRKLKPASYRWSVVARDDLGQISPESEIRKFMIDGVPILQWADGKTEDKFIYKTMKPFMRVAWERGPGRPVQWRVRVFTDRQPASENDWKSLRFTQLDTPLAEPGLYKVEAESLDENGTVLARSAVRTVEVEQAPPLPPPEFSESMPEEIHASDSGSVEISWRPVAEARQYMASLVDKDGKIVRSVKVGSTKAEFKELKTGEYKVVLQTIDVMGREGAPGLGRVLHVPEYSSVRAPALKKVNVK